MFEQRRLMVLLALVGMGLAQASVILQRIAGANTTTQLCSGLLLGLSMLFLDLTLRIGTGSTGHA